MKLLSIVTSLGLVFTLVACSGGGGRKSTGAQCPAAYNPIPMTVNKNQKKLSLKLADEQIPAGKYKYEGSQLYYVDKSDLRVLAVDSKQKDGVTFKGTTGCIRNARSTLHPMSLEGIYAMDVSADRKKILADVNLFTIGMDAGKFKVTAAKQQKTVQSPSETFVSASKENFLIETENNKADYELRSSGTTTHGEYVLSIKFKRTDQPPVPAAPVPAAVIPGADAPPAD